MNILADLRARIDQIVPEKLGKQEHICIIDPPDHPNVGDCAILLGELDFIRRHYPHAKVTFYDWDNYNADLDRFIEKASVLLLHGGGNFGDIWIDHQNFRNRVLERFKHKKTVQMPQSISFSDKSQQDITARLIASHSDFTFLVRDEKALRFAQEHFECETLLCPDMAFAMDPIERRQPDFDVFGLLRTDKEVAADHSAIRASLDEIGMKYAIEDWLDNPDTLTRKMDDFGKRLTRGHPSLAASLQSIIVANRRRYAESRVRHGIKLLSSGKIVVTDRLHAHIMACLLGIPNLVFDSWDGKISAFYKTWTADRAVTKLLHSPADLSVEAGKLLQDYARG